ncbi:MAG: terminase small subunit [Oscillospiraceae bacterium]|nr:terminase small subunit [Oscillospiraceae bacterium]
MTKELSKRQRKFLCCIAAGKNISEAAAVCGIANENAFEEGAKILSHPKARRYLSEVTAAFSGDCVEKGLERLIGGSANDAVLFAKSCGEELTEADVRKLDLYNVSEMKFGKGVCEIKFADRIKAIEKLNEIRTGRAADNAAQSFLDAISEAGEKGGDKTAAPTAEED